MHLACSCMPGDQMFSRLKPSNNFRRPARPTRDAKRVAARYLPGPTISKRYEVPQVLFRLSRWENLGQFS